MPKAARANGRMVPWSHVSHGEWSHGEIFVKCGEISIEDQIFVCYIRVAVISEAVIKGEINIAKA